MVSSKQVQELQDTSTTLRADLRQAKEALKTPADVRSLNERVSELQDILARTEQENQDLHAAMEVVEDEKMRFSSEAKALVAVKEERDGFAKEVSKLQALLQQAEEKIAGLDTEVESHRKAGAEQADKSPPLQERVAELETENASLRSEVEGLKQKEAPDQSSELEAKWVAEVARVQAEFETETRNRQTQHDTEVQTLRASLSQAEGVRDERQREVDELRAQLKEQEERASGFETQLGQLTEQLSSKKVSKFGTC